MLLKIPFEVITVENSFDLMQFVNKYELEGYFSANSHITLDFGDRSDLVTWFELKFGFERKLDYYFHYFQYERIKHPEIAKNIDGVARFSLY